MIMEVVAIVIIVAGTTVTAVGAGSVGRFVWGRCPAAEVEYVSGEQSVDLPWR